MELLIDFLVGNYLWFLVITIVLIFALIGYIVDSREHKEVSVFDSPQELAHHLEMLAAAAQNKTIGEAMKTVDMSTPTNFGQTNYVMPNSSYQQLGTNEQMGNGYTNNFNQNYPGIMPTSQNNVPRQNTSSVPSFEVLKK